MLTGHDLLQRIDTAFAGEVRRIFQFPLTRICITSPIFRGLDEEDRESLVCKRIDVSMAELTEVCNRVYLRLDLLTGDEPAASSLKIDRGHFWIRELTESQPLPDPVDATGSLPPVIHFYGYKGGQARSSVLCFFARALAHAGWRVLAIDVDAEAPSLDILFGVQTRDAEASLLGIRAGLTVTPVRAVTPPQGRGFVDILPFRPMDVRYELDAAALAMEGNIHSPSLRKITADVARLAAKYDVLLIDHRTGLASTVPPWVRHLPGPIVAFSRMDGQWRNAKPYIRKLWSHAPEHPGILVSFNADPAEREADYRSRVWPQAAEILEELAEIMNSRGDQESSDELGADEVADHWIVWPYEPAFNQVGVPDPGRVGPAANDKIYELRRLLQLDGTPPVRELEEATPTLHRSGALDEGDLIQTQALRDLRAENNPYTFILGRKGTGKTRLLRALAEEGFGEALLVPNEDTAATGVQPSAYQFKTLIQETEDAPEQLWWTFLRVALERGDTNRAAMIQALDEALPNRRESLQMAREAAKKMGKRRTFLVDGLEVAFPRKKTFDYVNELFRTIATLDSDPVFSSKVRVRVFIRTDLAKRGFENFEQQSQGRTLDLSWDTRSILNFALSRIGRLKWFKENFPLVVQKIESARKQILEGALSEQACDEILLEIFPPRLRRLNLNTTTFLRTYFSDDPKGLGSYYPRIYGDFLLVIAGEDKNSGKKFSGPKLENDRVSDDLINFAYEEAAKEFLAQVRAELLNLVDLDNEDLGRLIDAFNSKVTPFDVEVRCGELAKATGIDVAAVRQALDRMKTLGIFEDRPKFPGQWRAGRLFKTSLGMIYNRKRKADDPDD